ncbi:OLC1v1001335C1 [Oldenlandia corymbosa var. corymbosa]|uniref:OLC1v1001335C1 n=1 Tax=Oldenlandia corymbosa var. corymbosa TaxID=529605 RepID=A0AAV1D7K6_OLDCO|nr:OLC1v1001335C1 [Oldenlandia corymbosa var. corymbosa]
MIGNNFPMGFTNTGSSSGSLPTPVSTRGDVRDDDSPNATPRASTPQDYFSQFSTQFGLDNISLSQAPEKENTSNYQGWRKEEDVLLARAWLTVSNCSITGNYQDMKEFWKKITTYYNANRGSLPEREQGKLKSHWFWFSKYVNEFNQHYNRLWNEHRSGWSDDYVRDAAHEAVVSTIEESSKRSRINESGSYTSSSNADRNVEINEIKEEVRPIGQKAAKKGKRKSKEKCKARDDDDELVELRQKMMDLEAKKLEQ